MNNWLIIVSTLLGPILAVQAQKWIERFREKRGRKMRIFQALMATRAVRLSPEHVQNLNMIDVAFYGSLNRRTRTETAVLDAWKEYLDHLNNPYTTGEENRWLHRQTELFSNLLYAISQDLGYSYDKVELNKGAYSPRAHSNIENEQTEIRQLAIKVLSGAQPMKMAVTELPAHPDALATLASQKETSQKLTAALDGRGVLSISIKDETKSKLA
jgi:hypothetical protein